MLGLKKRIKAAVKAFKSPSLVQKNLTTTETFLKITDTPEVITDNQLLVGKNVLITGAGRNIGKAIAEAMAQHGANIYFTDINSKLINDIETKLHCNKINIQGFVADINNLQATDNICNYFSEKNIKIDILINNVGIQFEQIGINNITHEQRVKVFNTNVLSPMYLTQKIVNQMINNGTHGSIIFITSIHQFTPMRIPSYSASKAALDSMVKELAVDLSGHKIRVNGIAPGWVAEDEKGNTLKHPYTVLHQSSIKPSCIGRAAVYLASDYFSYYTTGTILKIDAGLSLYNYRVQQHPPTNCNYTI